MFSARVRVGLVGLALMVCASVASAQDLAPTLTGSATGTTVTLNWTVVGPATGYQLFVRVNGGPVQGPLAVGNVTTFTGDVPPGVYQIAVQATAGGQAGPLSNDVTLNVAVGPPPPPSDFAAFVNQNAVSLNWKVPAGVANVFLQAGLTPGGAEIGTIPMGQSSSLFLPSLAANTYYLRLFSLGVAGASAPSTELTVQTPGCVAPDVLPFTATSNGSFIQLSWPQVPGAVNYRLDAASTAAGGADKGSFPFPGTATGFQTFGIPEGEYYLTLSVQMSCGKSVSSAVTFLKVTPPVRLPAKGIGTTTGMVLEAARAIARSNPGDLARSCGNLTYLFRVLQRLRNQDNRFGLNWKRGVVGSLSQDVIVYNFSNLDNEAAGAAQVFGWDILGNHCGSGIANPQANNITNPNGAARWTILPYIQAGFAP